MLPTTDKSNAEIWAFVLACLGVLLNRDTQDKRYNFVRQGHSRQWGYSRYPGLRALKVRPFVILERSIWQEDPPVPKSYMLPTIDKSTAEIIALVPACLGVLLSWDTHWGTFWLNFYHWRGFSARELPNQSGCVLHQCALDASAIGFVNLVAFPCVLIASFMGEEWSSSSEEPQWHSHLGQFTI